jgi:phage/plasmid-like protein (TIGR03299 family)
MTSAVEKMAFAGQTPWHGLGNPVSSKLSAMAMRKAAGQDYHVSKRAVAFAGPEKDAKLRTWHEIKDEYALVRDSDEKMLSMVGSVYRPVQTEQVFNFFHDFVKAAKMEMETAGSLWGGKYVWALARVTGNDYAIGAGKKDEMRNYLLLLAPFEHGKALIMQYTSIRVVCWNTLCMALGANLKGKGHSFRMPHTKDFEVEKEEAKRVLGLITDQGKQFAEAAKHLATKKITKEATEKFFFDTIEEPLDAKRTPAKLPKFRAALEHAPGAMLPSSKGTWWGALNAVTYVIDHESGKSRDTALKNAWIGNLAKVKRRALELALVGAK